MRHLQLIYAFSVVFSTEAPLERLERTDLFQGGVTKRGLDKHQCLKRHLQTLSQATHPCAFAYSYARIRRLVRFGGGFYCGAVADESAIGFDRPPNIKARQRSARVQALSETMSRWLCVGHLRVCRIP
jgi:hypothetical protein